MKKAVLFGAGSIGRGFIGQLMHRSGYELVFIDIDRRIVEAVNAARRYPVRVVSEGGAVETYVENVRAVDASDRVAVAAEIVSADIAATAVGAAGLPSVATVLAAGLERRWASGVSAPLDIILCENLADADSRFRVLLAAQFGPDGEERLKKRVGFVRASVGRMVPVMTEEMREGNILRIWVEAYDRLPVDAEAFVGPIPSIVNMEPVAPFELYVRRKLYIHNLGHAVAAYHGALAGLRYIWEAVRDRAIREAARQAMAESTAAIAAEHGLDRGPLLEHAEDLLARFSNRALGDTVERVGRDLPRKLAPGDRILGAVSLCRAHDLPRTAILDGLAAALRFNDPASPVVADMIRAEGPRAVLEKICGIGPGEPDLDYVIERYEALLRPAAGGEEARPTPTP
jgi:mannitol-1-phosphate 5-dehydrogenase